ncbi:M48 family metalloprotease [Acinetobacter sp. TY1]|uniref:M48 family metalloprotease n=1 Tax=Acinetobacter sp. TY1 TaxID=3387626 RepID=UPI003AF6865B
MTVYGGQLASSVPTSRIMETEADLIGLDLMARAGYKPQATISFWDKTEACIKKRNIETSKRSDFLSSHPDIADRKKTLQANMASAQQQYLLATQHQKTAHQHVDENVTTTVMTFNENDMTDATGYSDESFVALVK